MTPSINLGAQGLLGWKILQRTEDRQMQAVAKDAQVQRETAYFRDRIEITSSADALVDDYRMLRVALSAFGLEDDISNRAFIKKILQSDLSDSKSLANRLSDKRYLQLAQAFGYGNGGPEKGSEFANDISEAFLQREFERRIGANDESLRLALNARRELSAFADRSSSDSTLWYETLGNPPLRKVFEGAFGFGSAYGKLPIDRQVEEFKKASERTFGSSSFSDITHENNSEKLIKRFLARSTLTTTSEQNRYSSALTLLSTPLRP